MSKYYVNNTAQSNGDHEVHKEGCYWLSLANNTTYVGDFTSCKPAIEVAKRKHPKSNGCKTCSADCHTS